MKEWASTTIVNPRSLDDNDEMSCLYQLLQTTPVSTLNAFALHQRTAPSAIPSPDISLTAHILKATGSHSLRASEFCGYRMISEDVAHNPWKTITLSQIRIV